MEGDQFGTLLSEEEEDESKMEDLQFDWDEQNIGHLARHHISPAEAEQVLFNRPRDIESQLRNGEERMTQVGETDAGRILIVVFNYAGLEGSRSHSLACKGQTPAILPVAEEEWECWKN